MLLTWLHHIRFHIMVTTLNGNRTRLIYETRLRFLTTRKGASSKMIKKWFKCMKWIKWRIYFLVFWKSKTSRESGGHRCLGELFSWCVRSVASGYSQTGSWISTWLKGRFLWTDSQTENNYVHEGELRAALCFSPMKQPRLSQTLQVEDQGFWRTFTDQSHTGHLDIGDSRIWCRERTLLKICSKE